MARIEIESDVTGTVWKIEVAEGAKVTEGQTLLILESMKMEIPVLASDAGTVSEIMVAEEEPVAEGQTVVVLDA
ncbi:MAG: acetyl-CoA carboxylase biotin carboxyl carrier protein subunit [Rhodospirillaceae bacterium]|nr:acetyl-CoA carboxylase biotin carboxyl carrier protein subunit [Rhodospirillaceae bacterium]OUX29435.1 MAG: acetyl-CoA carboxylase biotin carboxyl carrier protein subunit [Rhodospirillaceae bacterium TMED256]|tara:strand:+ start:1091 stop:1312 length:222 start_codon:yes stop_codon:yes gene_type:complete